MSPLVSGSRLPVGSSASSSSGRLTNARGDGDPLLLAAGQLVREPLRLALEADQFEHLGDHLADVRARLADHLEGEPDVALDGLVRQQPEVLEDAAEAAPVGRDLGPAHAVQVAAGDLDLALGRLLLPQQQPQEGRLAGAGRADEEDELALLHVDGHVVQRRTGRGLVRLGDVGHVDHGGRLYPRHPVRSRCPTVRHAQAFSRYRPASTARVLRGLERRPDSQLCWRSCGQTALQPPTGPRQTLTGWSCSSLSTPSPLSRSATRVQAVEQRPGEPLPADDHRGGGARRRCRPVGQSVVAAVGRRQATLRPEPVDRPGLAVVRGEHGPPIARSAAGRENQTAAIWST